jgi:N6-adenosine-specific RNA methylase IME4
LKVPGIDRAALVLSRQIGDGIRLCRLLNAFTYLIDSAFIIVDDSDGYRLLVRAYGQVVADRRCENLRKAKQYFRTLLTELVGQAITGPKWSDFFEPDRDFYIQHLREVYQFRQQLAHICGLVMDDDLCREETGTVLDFKEKIKGPYATILADPPWRFTNHTGKGAPEHKRLNHYPTLPLTEIARLPVSQVAAPRSHLYLWVPNALIWEGMIVMKCWGFIYKSILVWYKIRRDGGPDRRGVGFYFRNVTEMVLFGVRGRLRTLDPGRSQENIILSRKNRHSRKPQELYHLIEQCSPAPYLELFARKPRPHWHQWGNQLPINQ